MPRRPAERVPGEQAWRAGYGSLQGQSGQLRHLSRRAQSPDCAANSAAVPEVSRDLAIAASGRCGRGFLHELSCKAYLARGKTSMKRQKSAMATVGEYT